MGGFVDGSLYPAGVRRNHVGSGSGTVFRGAGICARDPRVDADATRVRRGSRARMAPADCVPARESHGRFTALDRACLAHDLSDSGDRSPP